MSTKHKPNPELRAALAGLAMQGILAAPEGAQHVMEEDETFRTYTDWHRDIADAAVNMADALLARLAQ